MPVLIAPDLALRLDLDAHFKLQEYRSFLRGVPRLVRAHSRRRLAYWGRYILSDIKRHQSVFKYRSRQRTKRIGPRLLNSMWTRRNSNSPVPMQQIGWRLPHGEVMEFGPRKARMWPITPKGFRSDVSHGRSGGGVALRFLRFEVRGKIVYARKVIHEWDRGQLREHVAPALKRHERGFMHDMGSIPKRVIEGKLR